MNRLDIEIKKLQKKLLEEQIEKIKEEKVNLQSINKKKQKSSILRALKFFIQFILPSVLQLSTVLIGYIVLRNSNFFTSSKNQLEADTKMLEYTKQTLQDSINKSLVIFHDLNIKINELNHQNKFLIERNKTIKSKNEELMKFITSDPFYMYYQLTKSLYYPANANNLIEEMNNMPEIKKMFQDSIRKNIISRTDTMGFLYGNYILCKTNYENCQTIIDIMFNLIIESYNKNLFIDNRVYSLLMLGLWNKNEVQNIQKKSLSIISEKTTDSSVVNINSVMLLKTLSRWAYFKFDESIYSMYKENTDEFIDLISFSRNIIKHENIDEFNRGILFKIIAYNCPQLMVSMQVSAMENINSHILDLQDLSGSFNIDESQFSYGKPLYFVKQDIMKSIIDTNFVYNYKDSVAEMTLLEFLEKIKPMIKNDSKIKLKRWLDDNMQYFRKHPDELISAIENHTL